MCFFAAVDLEVDQAKLILDIRPVTFVAGTLVVITSGGILNQGTIKIITSTLCFPQVTQHSAENCVVTAFERFIIYLLKQCRAVLRMRNALLWFAASIQRYLVELLLLPLRRSE